MKPSFTDGFFMSKQRIIPAYEQIYLLNQQLILHADQFEYAVITVGGQAVQYWVSYYYEHYERLPDERLVTSVDCDFSARKSDIAAIASTLNVQNLPNKDGQPPSLAQFILIDKDSHKIKSDGERLFAVPGFPEEANVVDIIDRPGGFERTDFLDEKLFLHTSPFYVEATSPDMPEMHEKIRVLNPVACMRSRFSNLIELRRNPEIEVARINALKIPCFYFLLEQFDEQEFQLAREIFMNLWELASSENTLRYQAFWHVWQGPLNKTQQSFNITLPDILDAVHHFLETHPDDFDIPEAFVTKELPRKLKKLRTRFDRYVELNIQQAARKGRRGFERNLRDDS